MKIDLNFEFATVSKWRLIYQHFSRKQLYTTYFALVQLECFVTILYFRRLADIDGNSFR